MGLREELGDADEKRDSSHWELPSISPHFQNRGYRDWVALIELVRDAWLEIRKSDLKKATRIAQSWFDMPYPVFKRLALFAASKDGCIEPNKWTEWLLGEDAWWLWAEETRRETLRLLVLQGGKLSSKAVGKIEKAILNGPPRAMFPNDLNQEDWEYIIDESIWLRLAKLKKNGRSLGKTARKKFDDLSRLHPTWKLSPNEREEFSVWVFGTGDPGYEESRKINIAPTNLQDLIEWLKTTIPAQPPCHHDTWREICRTHFYLCLDALTDLSTEDIWPAERWQEALRAWSDKKIIAQSWQLAAHLVCEMPDDVFQKSVYSVSRWLETASKETDNHETICLELCRRVLEAKYVKTSEKKQLTTTDFNHPIGHATETLLNLWFKRKPNDNDTLPDDIRPFFTQLCDTKISHFSHGRFFLAANLIALFRTDSAWTKQHLLPLFDWKAFPTEAKIAWTGFLWSPRVHPPLLSGLKKQVLDTVNHYKELDEAGYQFAEFLTHVALYRVEGYTDNDFQEAFKKLPQKGLEIVAESLLQSLKGSGEQREENWKNRIQPFWHNIWPKSADT